MPTLKQERLAEALNDPSVKSKTEAMIRAGYSPKSAATNVARQTRLEGTVTKSDSIKKERRDSARGLAGLAARAIDKGAQEIDKLDVRDKLSFGLAATKLAHEMGENLEERGSAETAKARRKRMMLRAWRAGFMAARAGRDPLHMVVSAESESPAEK